MWIRKQPAEAALNKYSGLARKVVFDILTALVIWCGLIRLFALFGVPYGDQVSGYVAAGLVALIFPASVLTHRDTIRRSGGTMVCDSCGALKTTDGRTACRCGGRYFAVQEMKWVATERWTRADRRRTQA